MTLIEDWKKVLRKAWSMRLIILGTLLSAAEVALPYAAPQVPSGTFALLAMLVTAGAGIMRVVAQKSMKD